MTYPFREYAEGAFKITATGECVRCVCGDVEIYRIEPYVCIRCGKIIDGEFAGDYIGLKAAEIAKKYALSLPCFWCMIAKAKGEVLDTHG